MVQASGAQVCRTEVCKCSGESIAWKKAFQDMNLQLGWDGSYHHTVLEKDPKDVHPKTKEELFDPTSHNVMTCAADCALMGRWLLTTAGILSTSEGEEPPSLVAPFQKLFPPVEVTSVVTGETAFCLVRMRNAFVSATVGARLADRWSWWTAYQSQFDRQGIWDVTDCLDALDWFGKEADHVERFRQQVH